MSDMSLNIEDLPRLSETWWVLSVNQPFESQTMICVLDSQTGRLRYLTPTPDAADPTAVVEVVLEAIFTPMYPEEVALPKALCTDRAALLPALAAALSPFGVEVTVTAFAQERVSALLKSMMDTATPVERGLITNTIYNEKALCEAACRLFSAAGWRGMEPEDTLLLTLEGEGDTLSYPIVNLRPGEPFGVVMMADVDVARRFYEDALRSDEEPEFALRYELLHVLFVSMSELHPKVAEVYRSSGLPFVEEWYPRFAHVGGEDEEFRPGLRASRQLLWSLEALASFFEGHHPVVNGALTTMSATVEVGDARLTVASRPDLALDA